ncbi:MAG: carboxypeptidase regulatory-like domain-containing protein [Planctomycetes bacterium]|nr:carboxypeptidase regulatory-like domain-containing protein [Planctomycetota bacterium]
MPEPAPRELHGVRLVLGGPALAIAGTVLDANGRPAKGWRVALQGASATRDAARTDRQGRFVLSGLVPGAHVLRAWSTTTDDAFESEPVEAGARDVVLARSR